MTCDKCGGTGWVVKQDDLGFYSKRCSCRKKDAKDPGGPRTG